MMKFNSEDRMKDYILSEILSDVLVHWSESPERI
jgi:hypothetical protein